MPVGVIYIVYKSIKQSVLLSAILPGALVLLQEANVGCRQGTAATPKDSTVPIRIHFNHHRSV